MMSTTLSLSELVASVLDEIQIERREPFGLRHLLVIDAPEWFRAALVKLLYALDQAFAASVWLPGTALYTVATKRPSEE